MLSQALSAIVAVAVVASTAAAGRVVAVMPLSTLGTEDTSTSSKQVTAALEAAIAALPDTTVIGATAVASAVTKSKRPALKTCEGEPACVAEIGKLVGATLVIAGEVGGLGDAKIVYLRATEIATAHELRSTTLTVGAKDAGGGPQGAIVRLLAPEQYLGMVHFSMDVTGATIYVNGSRTAVGPNGVLALPVGTQAVRVTHPEYHDFVRFIPVAYGTTTEVPVGMLQYPIVERDLQGKPINRATIVYVDPPVWRRWYVVGGAAVGLAIVAGVVAGVAASRLPDASACMKVGGGACGN